MRNRRHMPDTEVQVDDRRTTNKRWTDEKPNIDRKRIPTRMTDSCETDDIGNRQTTDEKYAEKMHGA